MSSGHINKRLRERIRKQAGDQCGYCHSKQAYILGPLEVDHIIPVAAGGTNEESNLWLACRLRNSYKSVQVDGVDPLTAERVKLFNPRRQQWSEHFAWSEDGSQIVGLTSCGRVTIIALQLNNVLAVLVRQAWIRAGWHPPDH
jgi:hypothetical protein